MTDLAIPSDAEPLDDFEGLPVTEAGIEIRGLEGGLRDAVKIQPRTFHKGERVLFVLDCRVIDLRIDALDKEAPDGEQRRVHILKAKVVAPVDEALVGEIVAAQAERIRKAKDASTGQGNLLEGGDDDGDDGPGMLADAGDIGDAGDPLAKAVETGDEVAAKRATKKTKP